MTITRTISKLKRSGFTVDGAGCPMTAKRPNGLSVIEFTRNGGADAVDVATIKVRRITDRDEMQSDYHAGYFCDSVAQAIAGCN